MEKKKLVRNIIFIVVIIGAILILSEKVSNAAEIPDEYNEIEINKNYGSVIDGTKDDDYLYGGGGNEVRPHQSLEADTSCQYGNDLRVGGHLGREENHGKKDEHRGEHVHKVRNEVGVILEDDELERSLVRDELIYLLAEVKDYHDADNQQQGNNIGTDELLDDVPVHCGDLRLEVSDTFPYVLFAQIHF